jgi:hypothetical protein
MRGPRSVSEALAWARPPLRRGSMALLGRQVLRFSDFGYESPRSESVSNA